MRLATCVIGVASCLLAGTAARAWADDGAPGYRAVIDRVELEPASIGGLRLRVELSALALQGQLLDLTDPKSIRLVVGGGKLEAPYALGAYAATGAETAIVVCVQANLAYADALPAVIAAFDDTVLAALGERTQVAFLAYGENTGSAKLAPLKTARGKLAGLAADTSTGDPALVDTLDRAMQLLKKAKPSIENRPLRKLIIAIGDGRDRSADRERVTKLGMRAAREGVRIHSFGFAPNKVLRSMLTLGELSKRSLGTFRWVRSGGAESWAPAFAQLRDEINKQYVLTYFLPSEPPPAGKLKVIAVGRTEATSNELAIPPPSCGGEACAGYCNSGACVLPRGPQGRGVLGWILLIAGVGLGAVVVLGVIGAIIQKRQPPRPFPGAVPGQVPGAAPVPGALPGAFPPPPGVLPAGSFPPGSRPPGSQPPGKRSWFQSKPPAAPPAPVMPPLPPPPPVHGPALLVITGPMAGQRIALIHGFTIGKQPGLHLVIDDGYTSSVHAQILIDTAGGAHIYDHQSTNGTFVNGVRVTEKSLDHGMSIRIGSTELRFLAQ